MTKSSIRRMNISELEGIYKHIKQDFMEGEYPPYDVLCRHLQIGIQEGLIFCTQGWNAAYSVCAQHTSGYVLISLLAVYEGLRGRGIGSAFLEEIIAMYKDRKCIIVEVEKPEDASDEEERLTRIRRIEFYEKAGFYMVPDINYSIWDIPLHIMVLPVNAFVYEINEKIGQVMYEIYLKLMGRHYIHKMKFTRVCKRG